MLRPALVIVSDPLGGEHLTGFSGSMQKKMNRNNCHCEEAKVEDAPWRGRRGNLLPLAL